MKVIVNEEKIVEFTPELMAETFWGMDAEQQAEFFHELASVINADADSNNYSYGEMQWLWMTQKVRERSDQAREIFLAFTAFAYDYWDQKEPF